MTAATLFDYAESRDLAMARVAENAGDKFRAEATAFVVRYLETHGPTAGEDITDACRKAGITPLNSDDRSFGPVYCGLMRRRVIEKAEVGTVIRKKGHGSVGGSVWKLVNTETL